MNENVNYIIQIRQQLRDMNRQGNQQNISYSQQNILANSIRIARERISKNGQIVNSQNQDKDNLHNQTFSFSKPKKQNSAAMAIKVLHKRISQLQAFNITLTKQNSFIKKQANLKNLQVQSYKSAQEQLEDQLHQYRNSLSRVQKLLKDKQHQLGQIKSKQKIKTQKYQQIIMEKTKIITDSQTVIGQLQKKVGQLNKRIENNQKIIVQMIKQLQQQKIKSNAHNVSYNSPNLLPKQGERYRDSKSIKSKDDNFPVIVEQPDNSKDYHIYKIESSKKLKPLRSQPKNKGITKNQKNLQLLNKELKQKNLQLYNMLRASDRKLKEQEKAKILCKERFYGLKNSTDSIIDQINRLPNNLSHRFKCLKVKKIEQDNLECLRSHSSLHRYRNTSNSSKQNSAHSKSRQKQLKMQDLSLTDNQIEARSHSKSKSKRRSITTFIHSHSGKKTLKMSNQQEINQNEVVRVLNKKIREQRKQICELSKRINEETDPQKIKAINIELQQKINKNQQVIGELESYKKERTKNMNEIN